MIQQRSIHKPNWFFGLFLLFLLNNVYGTVHPVANDSTDVLKVFIEDLSLWEPGDTILLSDASDYIITETVEIKQELTLMSDPALTTKPTVSFYENGFLANTDSINITLKNFKAVGIEPEGSAERTTAKALLNFDMPEWSVFQNIVIEGVDMESFRQIVQLYKHEFGQYESFMLHNCIVNDISGETALDFRKASVEEITITNNSFTNIEHGFFGELYYQDLSNTPAQERYVEQNVLIDQNTFYRVTGAANKSLIQNNAGIDGSVTLVFSNNIVSTLFWEDLARPFRINEMAGDFHFTHCVFHDFNSTYQSGTHNLDYVASINDNVTIDNISTIKPVFYDITGETAHDLTVANMAFYSMSSEGGLIGDPRWMPGPERTKHKIANTGINVLEEFMEDTSLWTPGDTILLGESSTYILTNTVDILQSVTVLGDPFLEQKPTVRFYDNGFRAAVDSIDIRVQNLTLLGIEPEDSSTTSQAGSLLRFDEPGQSHFGHIQLEDLDIRYFDHVITLYENQYGAYDSLTINNCYVRDINGGYTLEPNLSSIMQTSITNNTFINLPGGFFGQLYYQDLSNSPYQDRYVDQYVNIDHNTFFEVAGINNSSLLLNEAGTDGSVQSIFSNNIVHSLAEETMARPLVINNAAGDFQFINSAFYNFASVYQGGEHNFNSVSQQSNVTVTDCDTANPRFLDTTLLTEPDLTISNLLYLTFGTNGGLIGDPRWIPEAYYTIHKVGHNLEQFIEDITLWTPGDTILLTEPTYLIDSTIDIRQELTLMAGPELETKPMLYMRDNGFRLKTDSINIYFKGFKATGLEPDSVIEKSVAPAFLRMDQPELSVYKEIVLEGLDLNHFGSVMQLYTHEYGHYDSIRIHDCIVQDISGDYALEINRASVQQFSITNSTFIYVHNGFLDEFYFQDASNTPAQEELITQEIFIDHNTFYRVSGSQEGSFVNFGANNDQSIHFDFSNNIICDLYSRTNAKPFQINEQAGELLFTHSTIFNFDSDVQGYNLDDIAEQPNVTVQSIDDRFPELKDTAALDLRLWTYLPVRVAGTDGQEIGDPRWIPDVYPLSASHIHPLENTRPDILEWFIENTEIWQPGDTVLLISEGEYIEHHSVDIHQSIVILSDTTLPTKPVIRFYDNGFNVREDQTNVIIRNIDFDGFNPSNSEQAPYIIRYYTDAQSEFQNLVIDNCHARRFRGGIDLNDGKHSRYDSVVVNNVIWGNFDGEYCIDPNLNFPAYLQIKNSTFYNVTNGFLKNPGFASDENGNMQIAKDIIINQNTFYRVGGNNNSFLQINDPNDNSVSLTFSNNIVSELYDENNARPFRINEQAGSLSFRNSVIHEMDASGSYNFSQVESMSNVTTSGLLYEAPGYASPASGDFTLPDNSPLLSAGTSGQAIGDPRWTSGYVNAIENMNAGGKADKLYVYPNPASENVFVNTQLTSQVVVYDLSGHVVMAKQLQVQQSLDLRSLEKGVYILSIQSGDQIVREKLIKM